MENSKNGAYVPREMEKSIEKWLSAKEALVIRGPRQSGKTTLLHRLMETLKRGGVNKKRINFATFEDDLERERFEKDPKGYIEYFIGTDKGRHFFLFDEVQYVKNAGKLLKLVYDGPYNIKIIVTGSSTLDVTEIGGYLVGRAIFFELYPFSFGEFLLAKDLKAYEYYKRHRFDLKTRKMPDALFLDKLNLHLNEYLTYGGYPRIVLEKNHDKKRVLLKNLYLTYIEKDIVKTYGTKYGQKVSELIRHLSAVNSSMINYNDLCVLAGFYFKELKELLGILEETYIIKLVSPFHRNLATEIRKNPKVYFIDTGLRNFAAGRFEFSDEERGKLLENYVLRRFIGEKINYWRTTAKAEVDFVLADRLIPVEVKINPKFTKSFRSFINKYKPGIALVATMGPPSKKKIGGTEAFAIPAALL